MNTIKVFEVKEKHLYPIFLGCLDYRNFWHLLKQLKGLGMKSYNLLGGIKQVNIWRGLK